MSPAPQTHANPRGTLVPLRRVPTLAGISSAAGDRQDLLLRRIKKGVLRMPENVAQPYPPSPVRLAQLCHGIPIESTSSSGDPKPHDPLQRSDLMGMWALLSAGHTQVASRGVAALKSRGRAAENNSGPICSANPVTEMGRGSPARRDDPCGCTDRRTSEPALIDETPPRSIHTKVGVLSPFNRNAACMYPNHPSTNLNHGGGTLQHPTSIQGLGFLRSETDLVTRLWALTAWTGGHLQEQSRAGARPEELGHVRDS